MEDHLIYRGGREKCYVTVDCQSHLFKVKTSLPLKGQIAGGGIRGVVNGMSRASRKRMLDLMARLSPSRNTIFLTLTYPDPVPDPDEAKRHLQVFWKRLRRKYPIISACWKLENNSSGARVYNPHFHLLIFGVPFLAHRWVENAWCEIIGDVDRAFCWVRRVEDWKHAMAYVSKYIAKEDAGLLLDYIAYLTERGLCTGRMWGVMGRAHLPFGDRLVVRVPFGDWLYSLRRAAHRYYPGVRRVNMHGFTLYSDNVGRWFDLAHLMSADCVELV